MGFQINIKYKQDDEEKSKQIRIGKQDDQDNNYNELAGELLYWIFRTDIELLDIDVLEVVRRKLNIKVLPDGIRIKNRKYTTRSVGVSCENSQRMSLPTEYQPKTAEWTQPQANETTAADTQPEEQPQQQQQPPQILGYVVCNPGELGDIDPSIIQSLNKAGFTPGNRYQVVAREPAAAGRPPMITLISDNGEQKRVNADFFDDNAAEPRLLFDGTMENDGLVLRR